jgi:hypothetical protein
MSNSNDNQVSTKHESYTRFTVNLTVTIVKVNSKIIDYSLLRARRSNCKVRLTVNVR